MIIIKKFINIFIKEKVKFYIISKLNVVIFVIKNPFLSLRNEDDLISAINFNNYIKNINLTNKIEKVKKGLDEESKKEIDRFIYRKEYLLKNNIINLKKLYTDEELIEQKQYSNAFKKLKKEFKKFNFKNFYPEAIWGLSGLRWLPKEIKEKLNNGVFIDAGAYTGDGAMSFFKNFKTKKIYAFEPEKNNFALLKKNCQISPKDAVMPLKFALSNKLSFLNIENKTSSSRTNESGVGETIETITLDIFFERKNETINLIKMDIEGDEIKAISGASEIIKKYKPVLAISIYHKPEDLFDIKEKIEEICKDYKFIVKKANPFSLVQETMLLAFI